MDRVSSLNGRSFILRTTFIQSETILLFVPILLGGCDQSKDRTSTGPVGPAVF